ncbi:MAG: YraN family protein [Thermodesulfobacteriota bacterium]
MEGGRREVGKRGEDAAAQHLEKRGYKILERNFTCPLGEMDIIALDRKTLCFIEVKTLSGKTYGPPEIAVNVYKQRKLSQVALAYLNQKHLHDIEARFDVIGVTLSPGGERINLIKDAFELRYPGLY